MFCVKHKTTTAALLFEWSFPKSKYSDKVQASLTPGRIKISCHWIFPDKTELKARKLGTDFKYY